MLEHVHKRLIVSAATTDIPMVRGCRKVFGGSMNSSGCKSCESSSTIIRVEATYKVGGKVVPVEGFGRLSLEVCMSKLRGDQQLLNNSSGSSMTTHVDADPRTLRHPVVDECVSWTGVKRQDMLVIFRKIGDVRHAADVEECDGFWQMRGDGLVIDGD